MKTDVEKATALIADAEENIKKAKNILNKVKEKKGPVTERIKTVEDAFEEIGMDYDEFIRKRKDIMAPHLIATAELEIVALALNEEAPEEWIDWKDTNQKKWYPWFAMGDNAGVGFRFSGSACDGDYSTLGSRLVLKTKELSDYFGTQFVEKHKQRLTLINK